MKAAGEHRGLALLERHQGGGSVRAGIQVTADAAVFLAHHEYRLASHLERDIVAGIADLTLMRQVDPAAFEEFAHLGFENFFVQINLAIDAELTVTVIHQGGKTIFHQHVAIS